MPLPLGYLGAGVDHNAGGRVAARPPTTSAEPPERAYGVVRWVGVVIVAWIALPPTVVIASLDAVQLVVAAGAVLGSEYSAWREWVEGEVEAVAQPSHIKGRQC